MRPVTDYDQTFWRNQNAPEYWRAYLRKDLHEDSRDIVAAVQEHCKLPERFTLHEMGANLGRNLDYFQRAYPQARLSANDINPNAPVEQVRAFPELAVDWTVCSSQAWLAEQVEQGRQFGVVLSASHFIHIEDLTPFREMLPLVVGRYLVLRESAGVHKPGDDYWERWTTRRKEEGFSRWFDHDCGPVFAGTSLNLIYRAAQRCVDGNKRYYQIYIFEKVAGVGHD